MENTGRRNSVRRLSQRRGNSVEEERRYAPPRNRWVTALIAGIVGGIIALAVPITTVLINASLYSEEFRLGENTPYQIVATLTLWQCSAVLVDMVIAFIVGMRAGRITAKRWPGFVAGAIVGGIVEFGLLLIHYIPGYPEFTINNAGNTFWSVVFSFVVLPLAWAFVGSMIGLGGALVTAPRHPSYRARQEG